MTATDAPLSSRDERHHEQVRVLAERAPDIGLLRGIGVLGLTAALSLVLAVVLVLFAIRGLIPGVGTDFLDQTTTAAPQDMAALTRMLTAQATLIFWNGFILLPVFWLSLRWIGRGRLSRMFEAGFMRRFAKALLWGSPPIVAFAVWLSAQTGITPFGWVTGAPVLAAVLLVVLVAQTLTEEIIFRGYIAGWLARLWVRPYGWMLVQVGVFALLHPAGITFALFNGVIWTHLAFASGSLATAWALHLMSNLLVMSFVAVGSDGNVTSAGLLYFVTMLMSAFLILWGGRHCK